MKAPKGGLPEGCYRLLGLCNRKDAHSLPPDERIMGKVLASRGLLELLPGYEHTYRTTDAGLDALAKRGAP